MEAEANPHVFGLIATATVDGEYEVRMEPLGFDGPKRGLMIEADRLSAWLLSRGCEFCAHAVKLGRAVHCDHPPITPNELAELGFNMNVF
ncbi:MAG: hypothetical protein ACRYFU_26565 [Janthinobacterium lividum]